MIVSRGYGFDKEHQADRCGFNYLVAAGFNPGAGAVFFQRLMTMEKGKSSLGGKIRNYIYPHPKTSYRLKEQLQLLQHYSGGIVSVAGSTVYIKGHPAITPAPWQKFSATERAYMIAGRLARLAHDGRLTNNFSLAKDRQGHSRLQCSGKTIMTITERDSTENIMSSLRNALIKINKGA